MKKDTKDLITSLLDKETKKSASALFETLGLPLSTAINIFLRQCVRDGKIPFEITNAPITKQTNKNAVAGPGRKIKPLHSSKKK